MPVPRRLVCAFLVVVLLSSCSDGAKTGDPARDITKLVQDLMTADNAGDIDRVLAFYTDDAILMPPDGANVVGKTAIREHYKKAFGELKLAIASMIDETHASGDWAVVRGTVSGTMTQNDDGTTQPLHDKFMAIVTRDAAGAWRFSRLIWSPLKA